MTEFQCEAGQFKLFVKLFKTCNDECRLHLTEDGIHASAVDTANISMMFLTLPKTAIKEHYDYNPKCPKQAGLDLIKISRLLSSAKDKTPLTVRFAKDRVHISYDEIKACVKYLDNNMIRKDPNPPTIQLNTHFSFDGSLIAKMNSIIPSGEQIKVIVKNGIAKFYSKTTEEDVSLLLALNAKGEDAISLYDWGYLIKPLKDIMKNQYISVALNTDYPIEMRAEIRGIKMQLLGAPRIEAD